VSTKTIHVIDIQRPGVIRSALAGQAVTSMSKKAAEYNHEVEFSKIEQRIALVFLSPISADILARPHVREQSPPQPACNFVHRLISCDREYGTPMITTKKVATRCTVQH
jgi:hypothetical protein